MSVRVTMNAKPVPKVQMKPNLLMMGWPATAKDTMAMPVVSEVKTQATLYMTGILPLSAQSSYNMISMLNLSLLLAIMGGVLIVAISFRSVYAGIFALIANIINNTP